MQRENTLTEGRVSTTLLFFAVPFLISSFLQALYGAVDLFVVGQYADSAAVSAVAIGSQVMQTITGIILGISTGGTVLLGRRIGEKNERGAARAVGAIILLFGIMACILTPVMAVLTNQAVSLMETPKEAVLAARTYIFTCACGIPFIIGYNAVSGIFRGIGDSKTPVYFVGLACIVNVALDFLLAGRMGMGAEGAAIATVTAQGISFLASLVYLKWKGFPFPFKREDIHWHREEIKNILKVGCPLALQDALVNVSFLAITTIINTMGLVASAAVGVVEKIIMFAMLPPSSFASAVAAVTAQNLGAGKPERARKSLWWGIGYSLIFGVTVCILAQIVPETAAAVFSRDRDVIIAASQYLMSYSIDCILVSFVFCMNSYFSGCGNAMISFAHSMVATFGVRIPATYLLSRYAEGTLYTMGFAAPAATTVSLVICLFFLLRKHEGKGGKKQKTA